MVKRRSRKKKNNGWKTAGKVAWFVAKTPYYLGRGVYNLAKKSEEVVEQRKVKKRRESIGGKYEEFRLIDGNDGNFEKWMGKIFESDSKIGVILGARGTGKTAFGIKMLENAHARYKKKCYAIGFDEKEMPSWIRVVKNVGDLGHDAFVLVDEGGILFNSRDSMSNANKILSDLILVARHKGLSILFISQNSSNIEVNVLRQADFIALKPSSLLQKEFERKIIQKIYDKTYERFNELSEDQGLTYIYADNFKGFVSNSLPSFWGVKISKSFR